MSTPDEKAIQKPTSSRTGMYAALAVIVVVLLIVLVAWQAGWLKTNSSNNTTAGCTLPSSTTLLGAGSTFVYPLMFTWETSYTASSVTYSSVGSGAGITQLTAKTIDYGASDAPLSAAQRGALPGPAVTIPESAGGVSIIYNVPGVPTLNFSGAVLANIYLGTVTDWNDTSIKALNPNTNLPNQSIVVVHRSDGSGTTFAFTDFLSKSSTAWAGGPGKSTAVNWPVGTGEKGSSLLAGFVKSTQYTIGYVDLSYALTNAIQFGAVQNPAGKNIIPSLNNTAAAVKDGAASLPAGSADWYNVSMINQAGSGDYPITTLTYIMVYQSLDAVYGSAYTMEKAKNLVDFVSWMISPAGQAYSAQLYYVPLPANVAANGVASLGLVTYGGSAVSVCTPT